MNTSSKPGRDLFENVLIFFCKGIGVILAGVGVICGMILFYGFFQHLFALASS